MPEAGEYQYDENGIPYGWAPYGVVQGRIPLIKGLPSIAGISSNDMFNDQSKVRRGHPHAGQDESGDEKKDEKGEFPLLKKNVEDTLSPNEQQVDWTPESQMYGMSTISAVPRTQAEFFDRKLPYFFSQRTPEEQSKDIEFIKTALESSRNKERYTELPDRIKAFEGSQNLGGFTLSSEKPQIAYLNTMGFDTPNATSIHEGQHIKEDVRPDLNYIPIGTMELAQDLQKKYQDKYRLSTDFVGKGFYPELARIENTLPAGKNLFDTDIGKDLLKNNPMYKETYFNKTAPLHTTQATVDNHSSFFQDAIESLKTYLHNLSVF